MNNKKEHGIHADNREYLHYDQVEKDQHYRLAESEQEEFDDEFEIKTCDLETWFQGTDRERKAFSEELGSALGEIGFAILVGHGIDPALHREAEAKVIEIFTVPTLEEKLRYRAARFGSVNQGYFPIEETSDIHPDLVEGWVFCRRAFDLEVDGAAPYQAENYWPLPGLEPFFRRLCLANERLILPIMQSLLLYLGCDPHLYDQRLAGTNFGLRLNYYPPIEKSAAASGGGRLLGHEDVDLFTLLPAPSVEGLQVLNRRNRKWVRLDAPPGSIILNTGDYMQRITNDLLPSTTHRVSKPRDATLRSDPRVSVPMAVYLWEHEVLEVLPGLENPKYEPIQAITFHTRTTSKFYGDDYAVESS